MQAAADQLANDTPTWNAHRNMMQTPLSAADAPLLDLRHLSAAAVPPWSAATDDTAANGWDAQSETGQTGGSGESGASSMNGSAEVSQDGSGAELPEMLSDDAGNDDSGGHADAPPEGFMDYRVAFYTSRRLGAGTSAKVAHRH